MLASGTARIQPVLTHAQASVVHHSGLEHILSMFFRDDVMAWKKRIQSKAAAASPMTAADLKPLVLRNVKDCITRMQQVSTHHGMLIVNVTSSSAACCVTT